MFTAIALVAFSSVSMANTEEIKPKIKIIEERTPIEECCMYSAADQLGVMDPNNQLSGVESNGLYQFLYEFCVKTGGGDIYELMP